MLQDKFRAYIREHGLCSYHDRILLAVSGGGDSMVMMSLFVRTGYNVGVAHCNFQLRGAEADEDDVMVQKEAARLGIPYYGTRFDTNAEAAATGESIEMAARRLRYAWFEQLCVEHGYDKVAIAHHADDSVETFFINLLRGTGLRGLTGISVTNGRLIRPLLFSQRKEIIDFALSQKIPYREDSTNASTKYVRNKFRLGVIPRIRDISPRFVDTMAENVERLTAAQRFIDCCMSRIREDVVTEEAEGRTVIDLKRVDPRLPLDFVVFELMRGFGFNGEVINGLYRTLAEGHGSGKRFFSKDRIAYVDRGRILIQPIPDDECCKTEIAVDADKVWCGGCVLTFTRMDVDDVESLRQPQHVALLDADKLKYPLAVRRWVEGDWFVPFGMERHKKISDFLIDCKVPLPDKKRQLVVVSGDDIVWVVGRRIDDRYKIGSSTENVLRIVREVDSEV